MTNFHEDCRDYLGYEPEYIKYLLKIVEEGLKEDNLEKTILNLLGATAYKLDALERNLNDKGYINPDDVSGIIEGMIAENKNMLENK